MLEVVAEGLCFAEAPRFRDGRLWVSDVHGGVVVALGPDGHVETIGEVPGRPGGLGWLPDGTLLAVSMTDRRIVAVRDGATHADLAALGDHDLNDMVVDGCGRAYVGQVGFDFHEGGAPRATPLLVVQPDGTASAVGPPLDVANGMAITPDGAHLLVAETLGERISELPLRADGTFGERRVFADGLSDQPDGLCLDGAGGVWFAGLTSRTCVRVARGGGVLDRIELGEPDRRVLACARTDDDVLYLCTAGPRRSPAETVAARAGRVERVDLGGRR